MLTYYPDDLLSLRRTTLIAIHPEGLSPARRLSLLDLGPQIVTTNMVACLIKEPGDDCEPHSVFVARDEGHE